jgi:ABC-type transport system involved in multi-copper enzyme maturation permease subunit
MDSLRLHAVWVLAKRELRSTLYGAGIYLAILIAQIISSIVLQNYHGAIAQDRMFITASPLAYPLFIATVVCALYLALVSVTSISRDKDMQTLEVLFYGPVDHTAYVLSKYLKGLLSYVFIILFLAVYFLVVSMASNLGLSMKFLSVILLSFFLSSCVITFGIFVSTLAESVRTSVLLFLGIVGALIAIHMSHGVLIGMEETNLTPSLAYLRNTLSILYGGVKWVSPFYHVNQGMEAVSLGNMGKYLLSGGFSIIYSGVALTVSVLVLRQKGVRKTTGE